MSSKKREIVEWEDLKNSPCPPQLDDPEGNLLKDVHSRAIDYIFGKISFHDFDTWFASNTWDAEKREPEEVVDLINEMELKIAEYTGASDREKAESELKAGLLRAIQNRRYGRYHIAFASFIKGDMQVKDLAFRYYKNSWERVGLESPNKILARLALRLAEYTNGDWTETELRYQLAKDYYVRI